MNKLSLGFYIVGGIALTLGVSALCVSCGKNATVSKAEGENLPDDFYILNNEPFIHYVENVPPLENQEYINPYIRSYMYMRLSLDENNEYYISETSIVMNQYGDGLTQLQQEITFDLADAKISDNYYLGLQVYFSGFNNYFEVLSTLSDIDPIRTPSENGTVYRTVTQQSGDISRHWYNEDKYNLRPFIYSISFQRLYQLVNAYNSGYYRGLMDGKQSVITNPHEYGLYTDNDLNLKYNEGYNVGRMESSEFTLPALIMTIFNAPVAILGGALDFEIFGLNIKNLVFFLLTIGVVLWIISAFKSNGGKS